MIKYMFFIMCLVSCNRAVDSQPKFKAGDQIISEELHSEFNEVSCQERWDTVVEYRNGKYLLRYYNSYRELEIKWQNTFFKINCE